MLWLVCVVHGPPVLCSKHLGTLRSNLVPPEALAASVNHVLDTDELYVETLEGRWLEVEYSQNGVYFGWKPVSGCCDGKYLVSMPAVGDWTLNVRYQGDHDAPGFRIIVEGGERDWGLGTVVSCRPRFARSFSFVMAPLLVAPCKEYGRSGCVTHVHSA